MTLPSSLEKAKKLQERRGNFVFWMVVSLAIIAALRIVLQKLDCSLLLILIMSFAGQTVFGYFWGRADEVAVRLKEML